MTLFLLSQLEIKYVNSTNTNTSSFFHTSCHNCKPPSCTFKIISFTIWKGMWKHNNSEAVLSFTATQTLSDKSFGFLLFNYTHNVLHSNHNNNSNSHNIILRKLNTRGNNDHTQNNQQYTLNHIHCTLQNHGSWVNYHWKYPTWAILTRNYNDKVNIHKTKRNKPRRYLNSHITFHDCRLQTQWLET